MNTSDLLPFRFTPLFEVAGRPKGTLALAVYDPRAGSHAESYSQNITPTQIKELWPLIEDCFRETDGQKLSSRRICFQGHQRELHCYRRLDEAVMAVLIDCAQADTSAVEMQQLAARFEQWTDQAAESTLPDRS